MSAISSRIISREYSSRIPPSKKDVIEGAVMASDAFFPFPDSIKIASKANIKSIIQPGGSISDRTVIEETNKENISMVFTGKRCFSHS